MIMRKKYAHIVVVAALAMLAIAVGSCTRQPAQVESIQASLIDVDSTFDAVQDSDYLALIAPIKAEMEEELNRPLGTAPEALTVERPESTLSNWSADALMAMAEQWVEAQGTGRVDMAIVNIGGLRCEWPAGDITFRNVFELMPFDNELVILTMTGKDILDLAQNCIDQGGEGISKELRITINTTPGGQPTVMLGGKDIDPEATYYVATSDYLSGGADGLTALTHFSDRLLTGRKIRDLYIEYIQQVRIVEAKLDGRYQVK